MRIVTISGTLHDINICIYRTEIIIDTFPFKQILSTPCQLSIWPVEKYAKDFSQMLSKNNMLNLRLMQNVAGKIPQVFGRCSSGIFYG